MLVTAQGLFSPIFRFLDRVTTGAGYCGAFLTIVGMIGVCVDVFSRYFFDRPLGSAFDISRWTLLYSTLLMGGWVLGNDAHIKIDILIVRLNDKTKAYFEVVTSFMIVLACFALFYQGIVSVLEEVRSGVETTDTTVISKFWLTASIPAGSFLLIWKATKKLVGKVIDLISIRYKK